MGTKESGMVWFAGTGENLEWTEARVTLGPVAMEIRKIDVLRISLDVDEEVIMVRRKSEC
jgi:hypothetical protein